MRIVTTRQSRPTSRIEFAQHHHIRLVLALQPPPKFQKIGQVRLVHAENVVVPVKVQLVDLVGRARVHSE